MIYTDGIHMVADSEDEMRAFANALELYIFPDSDYVCGPLSAREHKKAVTRGAIELTTQEFAAKCEELLLSRLHQ